VTEKNLGRTGGFFTFGVVVNRKDDPTQSGKCRVRWDIGGLNQSDLKEEDLPWSGAAWPVTNHNIGHKGGPHTGLLENTKVFGFSPSGDGQDVIILGSLVSSGTGDRDGQPQYDSDIPVAAKDQENGGENQPQYDDRNWIITKDSITKYAQDEGGPDKQAAKFPDLPEPIGTLDQPIEA